MLVPFFLPKCPYSIQKDREDTIMILPGMKRKAEKRFLLTAVLIDCPSIINSSQTLPTMGLLTPGVRRQPGLDKWR